MESNGPEAVFSRQLHGLGLEAFGRTDAIASHLKQAGDWFLARYAPPRTLGADESRSYPEWLAQTLGHEAPSQGG